MDVDVLSKEYLITVCVCESVAIKTDKRRTDRQADIVSPLAGWGYTV